MNVEFFSGDPRDPARSRLDEVLSKGVSQLAIACAFCTDAGVKLLERHLPQLQEEGSFVVVSAEWPTNYEALGRLHAAAPGKVFVHWGNLLPKEKKNSAALMHSKVFYARADDECWLWTGSHNLTGTATQGGNCEAAVILNGWFDEQPFVDAIKHLQAIKAESAPYDPNAEAGGVEPERVDILVIRAEVETVPSEALPWHIQLCLDTSSFDSLLRMPGEVRLVLYPRGSLKDGWQQAQPVGKFRGALTGLNFTGENPSARNTGSVADWPQAQFLISSAGDLAEHLDPAERDVLVMGPPDKPDGSVQTQSAFTVTARSVDEEEGEKEYLLSSSPSVETELLEGKISLGPVDSDMRRFFTRDSIQRGMLVNQIYRERVQHIQLPMRDVTVEGRERLRSLLGGGDRILPMDVRDKPSNGESHRFLSRAKFRIRK